MFDIAQSTDGLSKEDFAESKTCLEPYLKEVVDTTKEFTDSIVNEGDYKMLVR